MMGSSFLDHRGAAGKLCPTQDIATSHHHRWLHAQFEQVFYLACHLDGLFDVDSGLAWQAKKLATQFQKHTPGAPDPPLGKGSVQLFTT